MDSMDKAVVIYEFTNNEKHTNESHAEINDKIVNNYQRYFFLNK